MGKTVQGNLHTYNLIEENGKQSLVRYNEKTKMWIKLNFKNERNPELTKCIKDTLKNQYIQSIIKS